MKKVVKKRQTIGESPLDALVPRAQEPAREERPARKDEAPPPAKGKERLTVHVPAELVERLKDAVYWTPGLTLAGLSERAFSETLEKLEKKNGGPFPRRKSELKGGRPLK